MLSKSNGKIVKRLRKGKKKVTIFFTDESKMDISPNTYTDFNIYPKKELSEKVLKEIKKRDSFDSLYNYALGVVSKKEISEVALRKKLEAKKGSKSNINQIISLLKKNKFIDESSLIDSYLEYAAIHLYGKNRIINDLYKKDVDKDLINKISFDEKEELSKANRFVKHFEKKFDKYSYEDKKKHIYESLMRYGYDSSVALKALDNISSYNKNEEINKLKEEYKKANRKYQNIYDDTIKDDKVIKYLLRKGYRYEDIKFVKEKRK